MSRALETAEVWLKRIKEQVTGVQYGTVQITIHNGQIVQIDRTERSRYDAVKAPSPVRKPR
ncbi:YezD family protein [Paenibacillus sp. N4]|uniref:YezD family protein n=1 Tax=Paenibacillus vietnamensis TaxID=2590547 RepID=UPI001CD153AE|nr:YezD family protein [Paenibacillus vietnamensis]MCA0756035.1 YezD family protein [Paenibacillus vietnamensis]